MNEISQKKELRLLLLWIAVYVVIFTICENISEMGESAYLLYNTCIAKPLEWRKY